LKAIWHIVKNAVSWFLASVNSAIIEVVTNYRRVKTYTTSYYIILSSCVSIITGSSIRRDIPFIGHPVTVVVNTITDLRHSGRTCNSAVA
jgi:hypothetical protein